jgi:hypothetical protein
MALALIVTIATASAAQLPLPAAGGSPPKSPAHTRKVNLGKNAQVMSDTSI